MERFYPDKKVQIGFCLDSCSDTMASLLVHSGKVSNVYFYFWIYIRKV